MRWLALVSFSVLCFVTVDGDCACSQKRASSTAATLDTAHESRTEHKNSEDSPQRRFDPEETCRAGLHEKMVFVKGGDFLMGTNEPVILADGEHPARLKNVRSFWLDATEVSNAAFELFVNETGSTTDAESLGDSFVLGSSVTDAKAVTGMVQAAPWWFNVRGASWRTPHGPGSNISKLKQHPVVHVSWTDAKKYCEYYNKRLPTETEWEMACKKSLGEKSFPWDERMVDADHQKSANIWQGHFPDENTKADGYEGTAPVDAYGPYPALPLRNMIGNVWEWTADVWKTEHEHKQRDDEPRRVKKGGSFMCHASYCFRYRCEARSENTFDTSASNVGFRCAADAQFDELT